MIHLHYWPTPNGQKVRIFCEEAGLAYTIVPVDIGKGDQHKPHFLAISPNGRMPAIVDEEPADGGPPLGVFESGAILLYLAGKTGKFLPATERARADVLQWLMWQMANLGPMAGQSGHFLTYAPEKIPYAIARYTRETTRLYGVLDARLKDHEFICSDYSIADMACYPWIVPYERHGQDINAHPHLKRWFETIRARPAVQFCYEHGEAMRTGHSLMTDEARRILFGR